jgi:hypothetical protein
MMALAAVAVHTAAMLAVTGLIASLVCRGLFFGNDKLAVFLQLRRDRCRIANQHD